MPTLTRSASEGERFIGQRISDRVSVKRSPSLALRVSLRSNPIIRLIALRSRGLP